MVHLAVSDYGRIQHMPFPAGWLKLKEQTYGAAILSVSAPDDDRVRFGFYSRRKAINRHSATEFLTILQTEPHMVSDKEQEVLGVVLRSIADPEAFTIDTLETLSINEQKVLCVNGSWLNSGLRERGYFANVDDRGEFVQELHFIAPQSAFCKYLPQIMDCVNLISWRPEYSQTFPSTQQVSDETSDKPI